MTEIKLKDPISVTLYTAVRLRIYAIIHPHNHIHVLSSTEVPAAFKNSCSTKTAQRPELWDILSKMIIGWLTALISLAELQGALRTDGKSFLDKPFMQGNEVCAWKKVDTTK